eukprot:scaffold235347_cov20-Tisochrysis_lutea.AAC.1
MLHNALHKLLTRKLCFPARAGGEAMFDKADELKAQLERASVRVVTDYRDNYTPGFWARPRLKPSPLIHPQVLCTFIIHALLMRCCARPRGKHNSWQITRVFHMADDVCVCVCVPSGSTTTGMELRDVPLVDVT